MINEAFHQWRQWGYSATESLAKARQDAANGTHRYPSTGGDKFGAMFADGLRWIEKPESAGFRFVGFADEVAPRRVSHTGWYTSEGGDTGETLRGAVYQLPARDGRPVYVAGYQEIGFGQEGAAALYLGELFRGDVGGQDGMSGRRYYGDCCDNEDAMRDAASRADRLAEIQAEASRDYDAAWQAGSRWNDEGETIAAARRDALAILKERRGVTLPPAMCGAVRGKVESLLETIAQARGKRAELVAGYWQREAFNEGAGCAVM